MSDALFDVAGRVAVVTGGLGQLGRQFTATLAARGAHVAIIDQRADPELVERHFGALPGRVISLIADLTQRAQIEAALATIEAELGPPAILINNAALDSPPDAPAAENGPFEQYPEESWDKVMAVNVKGVFLACQVIGGRMAALGRGAVINIASIYGLVSPDQRIYTYRAASGAPFFKPVAYSASKSALLNLTRYLATYWAPQSVRVNCVTFAGVFNNQDEQFLQGYLPKVPLGRMAREDEYNGAILFLASDASSYMTGSNLVIDGGWTAW